MKVSIRPAQAEDEERVVRLWIERALVAPCNDPRADFRFARDKPSSDVLVGLDAEGVVVGSVMVGHDGHRGWLYHVAARPDAERRGIGRQMVAAAEAWLARRGVVKAQLLVRETNTGVVAFYQRLGWETAPRTVMQKVIAKTT